MAIVRERQAPFLLATVWFSLLTAFCELFLLAVKKFALHRFIFVGRQVIWMAPVADLLIFAIPGLVLYVAARRRPTFKAFPVAIAVFAFLGFFSLLLMYYPLHLFAKLLLALGLAWRSARFIAARPTGFNLLVRRTVGWMAAIMVASAFGAHWWGMRIEREATTRLPDAVPGAPNVLLITLDTVRASSLSLYGYPRRTTPHLDELAKTSVVFDQAYSTAPWTLPSHGSIFTGRYPGELSVDWAKPLDDRHSTLAEELSAHGYITAGFVANPQYAGYETGLDRGFAHYEDFQTSPGEIARSSALGREVVESPRLRQLLGYYELPGRKTAEDVNRQFLEWHAHQGPRPFLAFLNYLDAHSPYLPPGAFATMFGPKRERHNPWLKWGWNWTPGEIQAEMDAYDGAIAYLDHHLGLLFSELQRRGVFQNTLVIITADHGEEFREHGLMKHGYSLYRQSIHVPLLISFPDRLPRRRIPESVTLRDLPASVIELVGLAEQVRFPGTSLSRFWNASGPLADDRLLVLVGKASNNPAWYPVSKGDMSSVIVGRQQYIKNGDASEELYDFEKDPGERQNLATCKGECDVLERFRTALKELLDERNDRIASGRPR